MAAADRLSPEDPQVWAATCQLYAEWGEVEPDRYTQAETACRRALALARWRSAGVPIPRVAITADDVSIGKPHPEPYLAAAGVLGVDPSRCLVFEDSPNGGEAARAAGAAVVAVGSRPWSFEPALRISDLASAPVLAVGP